MLRSWMQHAGLWVAGAEGAVNKTYVMKLAAVPNTLGLFSSQSSDRDADKSERMRATRARDVVRRSPCCERSVCGAEQRTGGKGRGAKESERGNRGAPLPAGT